MKSCNILVITYWSFDNALIQTYTLPYIYQIKKQIGPGNKIYLFTLNNRSISANPDSVRLQQQLKEQEIEVIDFGYKKFGLFMAFKLLYMMFYLTAFSISKRINYLHAWCTPGGAIAYIVSVLTGKKLILDSFEPHAETMVEGNTWKKNGLAYRLLFRFERLQLKRAKEVICAASGMIQHSQNVYGIIKKRYFVKPACVDLDLFSCNNTAALDALPPLKKNVCVYAGKFGGIYLEQEVFDFFKVAYEFWKGDFTLLLLTSHSDEEIKNYCAKSGFPFEAIIKRFVPHAEVPRYLALGNFGICPVKPLASKEFCTPIKNGEYWAMGLPVVITKNISEDSAIIEHNNIGYVLKDLSENEYLKAVTKMDELIADKSISNRIRQIAFEKRNFKNSMLIYESLYP